MGSWNYSAADGVDWKEFFRADGDGVISRPQKPIPLPESPCQYHHEVLETLPAPKKSKVTWIGGRPGLNMKNDLVAKQALARARWHQNYGKYARGMPLCDKAKTSVPVEIEVVETCTGGENAYTVRLTCPHCRDK